MILCGKEYFFKLVIYAFKKWKEGFLISFFSLS